MTEFKPTHIDLSYHSTKCIIIHQYIGLSCVVYGDGSFNKVKTSDLVPIPEEPKAPQLDGFELVEIDWIDGTFRNPVDGTHTVLSSLIEMKDFAGFVYEENPNTIYNESRMFLVKGDKELYELYQSGFKNTAITPKYVAFTK